MSDQPQTRVVLVHQSTGRRYEVMSFDRTANTVKLRGQFGTFDEPFDKARFRELGYELTKEVVT